MTAEVPAASSTASRPWWHEAVFYQVYQRSFADANGDGIGDLAGLIERLDHLVDLGIDAVWLSPHYPSPFRDLGYDISDFRGVDPAYGTIDDAVRLLEGAHACGIRVVLDLVLNHTSDQHPWFVESRASAKSPRRDWYLWRPGRGAGPPNDWVSQFGGPAWQRDEATGEYYYHCFLPEQPDLNWRNPEVRESMWGVVRFWLDLGVDGFRLDSIGNLLKAPDLPDHAVRETIFDLRRSFLIATSDEEREPITARLAELFRDQVDQPGLHELMRDLRRIVDEYPDRVLIGETDQVAFYGDGRDELDLVFNFPLLNARRLTPSSVRANQAARAALMPPGTWPANTLGNHDQPRVRSRYGDLGDDLARARINAALMLTLPGTPFLYNGEEIGMTDLLLADLTQFRDTWGVWFHDAAIAEGGMSAEEALALSARFGRDKNRTPMQWTRLANAGFSPSEISPWLPVNPNYLLGVNVADQRGDPASLLRFYRRMLRVRRRAPALRRGDLAMQHQDADDYLAFLRRSDDDRQACLVVLNMSARPRRLAFDLPTDALWTLFSSGSRPSGPADPRDLAIDPYEVYIGELD